MGKNIAPNETRVVVIGNGMVGHRFCERLRELDPSGRFRLTVLGEEPRPAYDRVRLTSYFTAKSADELRLADELWYLEHGIDLRLGVKATRIDRESKHVETSRGDRVPYDHVVVATGSSPFVPRLPGVALGGVFVYRTLEDLDAIMARCEHVTSCAVIGGGLLGLEAARAVQERGLRTHIVELAPRLMPRQIDESGSKVLEKKIETLGVELHLGRMTRGFVGESEVRGIEFDDGSLLKCEMIIISAGIVPRDEIARASGLEIGPRGGIVVDDMLRSSDPNVSVIGEVALHRGMIYGLVAPGYEMAALVARRLVEEDDVAFPGADLSSKLKLMGVDVASFGEPFKEGDDVRSIVFQDHVEGVYKKVVFDGSRLVGGMLVGDASDYGSLLHLCREGGPLPERPEELVIGARGGAVKKALPDAAQVCSCNNVSKGDICRVIRERSLSTLAEVKTATCAGTGCGGCVPMVSDILDAELASRGQSTKKRLCEHFDFTRQDLYEIVRVTGVRTFEALLASQGSGHGCEICKPTVASILASVWNEHIVEHAHIQDTNDRFLANIQRKGLYSIVPRVPGGEITPEKLIALGRIAKRYDLYTKITGGQRIDLFGARLEQLPDIWEDLVSAGFESGHAYAKGLRTVKSCVGSTWCRYGVDDSVGLAIRLENRYKGIRSPHKLKSAVSGCVRECAEAQSKDFGVIATENGWNLYVCGNGGAKPRHADLLASDLDEVTLVRSIDRFLMFYIKTADRLMRTSTWLEKLEGGIEHVRDVVMNDSLGIGEELERQMQSLVDGYHCEWAEVVKNPEKCEAFRHFATSKDADPSVSFLVERGQKQPTPWTKVAATKRSLPIVDRRATDLCAATEVPRDGGVVVAYGRVQLAIYHYAATDTYYVSQNNCPHTEDQVLARGLLGDHAGVPKVACPHHKKTFSLETGECLSGDPLEIATFRARVQDGRLLADLPPAEVLEGVLCPETTCHADAAE